MLQFGLIAGSMFGIIILASLIMLLRMRFRLTHAVREAYSLLDRGKTSSEKAAAKAISVAPVARYLQRCLPAEHAPIIAAELMVSGHIRPTPENDWREFSARETIVIKKPALIWRAVIKTKKTWRNAQLIYVDESGSGSIKLFGFIPLMESHGEEADVSLLSRFLTETVWFPSALSANGPVKWKNIDDSHAKASIKDGQLKASATFEFDRDGDVSTISSDDRFRDYRGSFVHEHFVMRCGKYREFEGFRVPTQISFSWQNHNNSGKDFEYARFELQDAAYTFGN